MSRRRIYLWLGLIVVCIAMALSLLDAPLWVRAPFGLAVVTLIPGYGLLEVLDPKGRLGSIEHLALSIGCSIAITLVSGLLLSASPAGLRTVTWTAALGGFSIAMTLLALHKTREPSSTHARPLVLSREWLNVLGETGIVFILTTTLALALASVAATGPLGSEQGVEQGRASVLQLWAIPDSKTSPDSIEVGIENPTALPIECTVIVRQGQVLIDREEIVITPGDVITMHVQPAENASIMFPVEVVLTSPEGDETLRRVAIWPSVTAHWTNQAVNPEG